MVSILSAWVCGLGRAPACSLWLRECGEPPVPWLWCGCGRTAPASSHRRSLGRGACGGAQYIKGKVVLSALIGVCTAFVLLAIGLDLWLVFGTLAFWLNFVPNVGAVIATLLPLPLVLLDPSMPAASMVLAFVLPFCVHMFVGNVLEPLLFGHSLEVSWIGIRSRTKYPQKKHPTQPHPAPPTAPPSPTYASPPPCVPPSLASQCG